MFDLIEGPLDVAEAGAPTAGDLGRNIRCGASRLNASAEPIGIVSLVRRQDRSFVQTA
jgi:hypothetical protein